MVELAVQLSKKNDLSGYQGRNPEFIGSIIANRYMFDKHCSGMRFNTGSGMMFNDFGKEFLLDLTIDWSIFGGNEGEHAANVANQVSWKKREA